MPGKTLQRKAYSVLDVNKSFTEGDTFKFSGIASTPKPDRAYDIVDPMGAIFTIPMPLLMFHDFRKPVGNVIFAQPTPSGIPFEAEIPIIKECGTLKDRVDEAIQSIQYNLIKAVSIGFSADIENVEMLESGGMKFNVWEWNELSLVTVPMNADAVIEAIRSIDGKQVDEPEDPAPTKQTRVRVERTAPKGPFKFIN